MRGLPPVAITAMVFVVGFALCTAQFPSFASTRVAANLLTDNAFLGIVAAGMTFVIISGGIDLSVGSVIGFTTVFVALAIERLGMPPLVAFVAILLLCAAFGAAMGAVIHFFDMPPFIVTLAGMFLARGASFLMSTESTPISAPLYSTMSDFALPLPGGPPDSAPGIGAQALERLGDLRPRRAARAAGRAPRRRADRADSRANKC